MSFLCPLWQAHFIIVLLMLKLLPWPVWEGVRQVISMFIENLGGWMDGKNFSWASNAVRGRGSSRWKGLQKESTMGLMHLLQSTWADDLWVRPNPKRLNMHSQRMEAISRVGSCALFQLEKEYSQVGTGVLPRKVQRPIAFIQQWGSQQQGKERDPYPWQYGASQCSLWSAFLKLLFNSLRD